MADLLIALDDGHGMQTPGKRTPQLPNGEKSETGNFMHENEFNRAVVKYLDAELKNNGFKTLLVAPTNADTPLETRTSLANSKKANLYLSVHANANAGAWFEGGGIETYVSPSGNSKKYGEIIHNEVIKGTPLKNRGVKDGSHLWVIRKTSMPSILFELGFMDSRQDYKYLLSDSYRRECAREIAKGVCKCFGVTYKEIKSPPPSKKPEKPDNGSGNKLSGTVTVIVDSLFYYDKPDWKARAGTVKKGEVFTVVSTVIVSGSKMYKLKSGNYISANPKYVKYTK